MHGTTDAVVAYSNGVKSVASWVSSNGCPATAQVTNNYQGSSTVRKESYSPCSGNTEVVFLIATGMGHTWMSQSGVGVSAAAESWNFMKKYSLSATEMAGFSKTKTARPALAASARYANGSILLLGMDDAEAARLVDVKGCEVFSWNTVMNQCSLSLRPLAHGIYFLSVILPSGVTMLRISVQ